MTVFADASALVAIIRQESDAVELLTKLEGDEERVTSGMALWETICAVAKGIGGAVDVAEAEADRLCATLNLTLVSIGPAETAEAIRAHARYGKGTGHPARLNMGDCFAYACARTNGAKLLYKGDDFARTDLK